MNNDKKTLHLFKELQSVSDIVDVMIQGLKKQWVTVNMNSFGNTKTTKVAAFKLIPKQIISVEKEICFGCAATNTLCELMRKPFDIEDIENRGDRCRALNHDMSYDVLRLFEYAIDSLRMGHISKFIYHLKSIENSFSFEIHSLSNYLPLLKLPYLDNHNWKTDIKKYVEYRNYLRSKDL